MKIAVYTCITDNYAPLVAPAVVADGVDYLCFSDGTIDDVPPWKFKPLKPFFANPIRNARLPKILSHRYLADYDFTIWLDASLQLSVDPRAIIDEMGDADFAAIKNERRTCLDDEFFAIRNSAWVKKGRLNVERLDEQEKWYAPRLCDGPVYYGGLIARRRCKEVDHFNLQWFADYCLWQHRDLPAMNLGLMESDLKIKRIPGDIKNNEFARWVK